MKVMKIEKQFELEDPIQTIERLGITEGLQYKKEAEGIRAIGPLYVTGSYQSDQGQAHTIRELIDMDVFAPNEKLGTDDFYVEIGTVSPTFFENRLEVEIELRIFGLKEEDSSAVAEPAEQGEESDKKEDLLSDCFEDLFEDEATTYTTCRIAIAKESDTYATIAQRFHVAEAKLRSYNQERELRPRSLVLLPPLEEQG